jgi:uncharacterized protein YdeI (YjbR/CyaY-like superfamily)
MKPDRAWKEETAKLRDVLRGTKLEEERKWNLPCYTSGGKNIAIIQPFKSCLALLFFKGALLKDRKGLLVSNGPNSQSGKRFEFRSVDEISKLAPAIRSYVAEAIKAEQSGRKVTRSAMAVPAELKSAFARMPKLKKAFDALTPGRQRAYLLHFLGAKQSATRQSRIDKCVPRILKGIGFQDR